MLDIVHACLNNFNSFLLKLLIIHMLESERQREKTKKERKGEIKKEREREITRLRESELDIVHAYVITREMYREAVRKIREKREKVRFCHNFGQNHKSQTEKKRRLNVKR